jgi:transposase-like protein
MIIPTISEFAALFPTEDSCFQYLMDKQIFYENFECEGCGGEMQRNVESKTFRCYRRHCNKRGNRISMRKGTFFFESSLGCKEILQIAQLWLSGASHTTAIALTGHSSATLTNFYAHFRQLVTQALAEEDQVIGGPGIEVEIDETKLGKQKYHRGHRVDGVWVVVGIERGPTGKIFMVPVETRDAETIREIVFRHVRPGSTIYSDYWKGYSHLEDFGLTHLRVNHSQTFKDPVSGACTNTVEGLNSGIKRRIMPRNRTKNGIKGHLGEYVWRRQNKECLFEKLIEAMRDIHYEIQKK